MRGERFLVVKVQQLMLLPWVGVLKQEDEGRKEKEYEQDLEKDAGEECGDYLLH
jgi:hypothetical protein